MLSEFLKNGNGKAVAMQRHQGSYQKLKRGPNFGMKKSTESKPTVQLQIESTGSAARMSKVDRAKLMREIDFKGVSSRSPERIHKGSALSPPAVRSR